MHTRQWAIVFFLFAFLLLPGIDHGIWRPDEPLVAGICSEMARSGDYIVPHLNGTPFLEKPPLYKEGVYIWTDKKDKILGVLRQSVKVAMLREQRIGNKMARLAHIVPGRQAG
jgi:hypothetical protein